DLRRSQKQPIARQVLDRSIDHFSARPTRRRNSDGDTNCFPLVHVLKGKLYTHVHEIKSSLDFVRTSAKSPRMVRPPRRHLAFSPQIIQIAARLRAHSSVVEHRPFKPRVEGSRPSGLTLTNRPLRPEA